MLHRPRRPVAVLVALAALAAACSDSDDGAPDLADAAAPSSAPITSSSVPPTVAATTEPTTTPTTAIKPTKPTKPPTPTTPPETAPEPQSEPEPSDTHGPIGGPGAGDDELYPDLGTADLDVQHYDVRIAYDHDAGTIDGRVTIEAALTARVDEIVLDAVDIDVAIVRIDDDDVEFTRTEQDLIISLPAPLGPLGADEAITIDVGYQDTATSVDSGTGLPVGWFATSAGSYVLNEPDGASTWLPSNDHPADKATWHFELTVPAGVTAVANGELAGTAESDGATTWVWDQREPMSTYLMLLLTGDYRILDGGSFDGIGGAVPLVNVALASDVERMAPYFALTAPQLAFFEPLFGPYPLNRYGLAFSDSFGGLAMETQGRSLFSRDDFPGGTPDYLAHLFTSHELAHQWFGDAVSPADWRDLWLNEAFATYGEWLWLDHVGQDSLEELAEDALEQRQLPTEPTGSPTVDNLFGFERYDGGAVVVHALRAEIGDDAFFTLLQRWVADNDGASRTSEDFMALAAEVSGADLDAFFLLWLYSPSVPADYPT